MKGDTTMKNLFTFEKVTLEEFVESMETLFSFEDPEKSRDYLQTLYYKIKLPQSQTTGSSGFDFFLPFAIALYPGSSIVIPTGIRWVVPSMRSEEREYPGMTELMFQYLYESIGFYLAIYPRSGLGFKYHVELANTVGIIDQDYWKSDNQGHIKIKLSYPMHNDSKHLVGVTTDPSGKVYNLQISSFSNVTKNPTLYLDAGDAFVQGIVTPYIKNETYTEQVSRNGGFGSTSK